MQTSLGRIAYKARTNKEHRFRDLVGLLNEEYLLTIHNIKKSLDILRWIAFPS